ncbi:MAG: General stress protein 16O [Candidatus Moanabacter tarae]|uniref:General stress protein 16O n=1 Tax=Candidatus Moanibacter tarae TaxID=2200854 RepID=A0A2Z4ACA0_9BACT|nr:MAG: General stress protein 16O [Candidatus Moanabacter tarae]|tara:strand:- start:10429 stop:11460 length:1032 start_codon:yes stop_codon:yes gene_type:complete
MNSKKTKTSNGNTPNSPSEKTLKKKESTKTKSTKSIAKKKKSSPTRKSALKSTVKRKRKTPYSRKKKDSPVRKTSDKYPIPTETNNLESEAQPKDGPPSEFEVNSKTGSPIVFSFEDVQEVIRSQSHQPEKESKKKLPRKTQKNLKPKKSSKPKGEKTAEPPREHRQLGAASLADILGYNPITKNQKPIPQPTSIPRKHQSYYRKLIKLRDHLKQGLRGYQDPLKGSGKDDSNDGSPYNQNVSYGETDDFERDFTLNLVSNEQDVLIEIEAAIDRIFDGSYGICEVTGKAINRERLAAIPFTRFSVEGQMEYEASNKKTLNRQTILLDSNTDSGDRSTFEEEE